MRAPVGAGASRRGGLGVETRLEARAYEYGGSSVTGLSLFLELSFRTTAMLLVLIHQFDLALEACILESLPFEIEFDLLVQRRLAYTAFVETSSDEHAGSRQGKLTLE